MPKGTGYGMKARAARMPKNGKKVSKPSTPDSGKPSEQHSIGGTKMGRKAPSPDSGKPTENR